MIPVSKPFLPPLEEYVERLRGVWERGHVTNAGPLVAELEDALATALGVAHVVFVTNGTVALQFMLRTLERGGEIVTTPFSYVATTAAIAWEGFTPVFADIEPTSLTVAPGAVEQAITDRTRAILVTHVYGNPCDVDALESLGAQYGIPVFYDAAHAFGVTCFGRPICQFGRASALSFHATKLFHTIEGGAVATDDAALAAVIAQMRNFGQQGPDDVASLGVNGKNSEIHAAMGLCLLPKVPQLIEQRRAIAAVYDSMLPTGDRGVMTPVWRAAAVRNFSYYPILVQTSAIADRVIQTLKADGAMARRYFRPSLNRLPYGDGPAMAVADDVSERVVCLPLYAGLSLECARSIAHIVTQCVTDEAS